MRMNAILSHWSVPQLGVEVFPSDVPLLIDEVLFWYCRLAARSGQLSEPALLRESLTR